MRNTMTFYLLLRPFLRPLAGMVFSLVVGFAASGLLWWLAALLVPLLIGLAVRFGKIVVFVAVALAVAGFVIEALLKEDKETQDAVFDWCVTQSATALRLVADMKMRMCLAWPHLPVVICGSAGEVTLTTTMTQ